MKTFVFLLAIAGLALSASPGFEYRYKYSARLATGIPNTRSNVAGTGIEFDVVVAMTSASEAVVQFQQVKFGDYHGDVDCDWRDHMPLSWQPMPEEFKMLEHPFKINLLETKQNVMGLADEEAEWMTNIRKSVVNHLRIAPLRPTMGEHEGDVASLNIVSTDDQMPRSFTIEEDTILGRCPSQYTVIRMPSIFGEIENSHQEEEIKEDAEFGKDAKEHLWRVVRSIDFRRCQDTVFLQQSGSGNATHGHSKNGYMQSRTSTQHYILRGNQKHLRLERGISEGSYVVETYGYSSQGEHLQLVTNQTMQLVSAKKEKSVESAPIKKHVHTWKYQVISPYKKEGNRYDWVRFLEKGEAMPMNFESVVTGIEMDNGKIEEYKQAFMHFFEQAIDELMKVPTMNFEEKNSPLNSNSGKAAIYMQQCTFLVKGLKAPQIEEIYKTFANKEAGEKGDLMKMLIVDVIASAGTRDAAKVLLEKFQAKEMFGARAATVFMTYANNIVEPELYHDVLAFLKNVQLDTHPFFGAAAFINFAQMVNRQCISDYTMNYTIPSPVLGDRRCHKEEVLKDFLPMLKERLESSKTAWQQAIYAQAIGNLGTPEVIEVLRPYIYGEKTQNPRVRSTAMYGLASWKLPSVARDEVFEKLMKIVDNIGEEPEVRQRAIKVLLSWQPNESWWQRLAAMTWHEPSRQMRSFISSTIYSETHFNSATQDRQSHAAKYALHLAKPAAPALRWSTNFKFSKYNRPSALLTEGELSTITNEESVIPRAMDSYFMMRLGGYDYRVLDLVSQQDGIQKSLYRFFDQLRGMVEPSATVNIHNSNAREATDLYQQFLADVKYDKNDKVDREGMVYAKIFDNMQQYIQLNEDVFNKYLANNPSIIEELVQGKRIHMTKYLNPVPVTTAIASEVGLPVMAMTYAPTMLVVEGKMKLTVEGSAKPTFQEVVTAKKINAEWEINTRIVSKSTTTLRALVPWTKKAYVSGMDSERQVNLPIKATAEYNRETPTKFVKLSVAPTVSQKFLLLGARNTPFTMVNSMWHSDDLTKMDFRPQFVQMKEQKPLHSARKQMGKTLLGLQFESQYDGDVPYPFVSGNIWEVLRQPERLMTAITGVDGRQYRFALFLDPSASSTKEIKLKASGIFPGSNAGEPVKEKFSLQDSDVKRYQKGRGILGALDFEHFGSIRMETVLAGAKALHYDAGMFWYSIPVQDQEKVEVMPYFFSSAIPEYTSTDHLMCVQISAHSPRVSRFRTLPQILSQQPHVEGEVKVFTGTDQCEVEQVQTMFKIELSEERKNELMYELAHPSCSMGRHNNSCNSWPIDAVYDRAMLKIKYDAAKMPTMLKNATFIAADIGRGMMFPQIYFNYMNVNNPEGKITIRAERPLKSQYWNIWNEQPHSQAMIHRMRIPRALDAALPIGGAFTPAIRFRQIFLGEPVDTNKCVISKETVKTYDGTVISIGDLAPTKCWSVIAHDRTEAHAWVLEGRINGGALQARLVSPTRASTIEMVEGNVKINADEVKPAVEKYILDTKGEVFAIVHNINGKFAVELPSKLTVYMHDGQMEVKVGLRYKGLMSGLCGDFNGEYKYDLKGPQRCVYDRKHRDVFYMAYISQQTDCPEFKAYKEKVAQFQGSCKHAYSFTHQPDITHTYYKNQQYTKHWYYDRITLADRFCNSLTPVSACNQDSAPAFHVDKMMVGYKCWMKATASADVKTYFSASGEQKLPYKFEGDFHMTLPVENHQCIRKN